MWWIAALLIGLVGVIAAGAWFMRSRGVSPRGMKEFAKLLAGNTDFGRAVSEGLQERSDRLDEANVAPPPTLAEIPLLIEDLLSDDDDGHYPANVRLKKSHELALPFLWNALGDPRVSWRPGGDHALSCSAMERLWNLLWPAKARELGERFGTQWDHADWRIFTKTIAARAATGKRELIPWALELLSDRKRENADMRRDHLLKGLEIAIAGGWADKELVAALESWARANITTDNGHPLKWSIEFMTNRHRETTLALLMSDAVLSLDNSRNIHFVLDELGRQKIAVPAQFARSALQKALHAKDWPWNCTLISALKALACTEPQEAIAVAESVMLDTRRSHSVITFLHEMRGLPRTYAIEPPPELVLSAGEHRIVEHLMNVVDAEGQIGNGGLSQYFFNPSGDNWRRDQASFTVIGFPEGTQALEKAAFIVASDGASTDRATRVKQYADLPEDREKELDALDKVFWGSTFDAAKYQYMVKHAELFCKIRTARMKAGMDAEG